MSDSIGAFCLSLLAVIAALLWSVRHDRIDRDERRQDVDELRRRASESRRRADEHEKKSDADAAERLSNPEPTEQDVEQVREKIRDLWTRLRLRR